VVIVCLLVYRSWRSLRTLHFEHPPPAHPE
jgi:hypothetical protein